MCCAVSEHTTPTDASASPSWKWSELFTVSKSPV